MSAKSKDPQKSRIHPAFQAGVVAEPSVLFGGGHRHIDPKTGLALYGPYSSPDQVGPPVTSIRVGIVTTGELATATRAWLRRCQGEVINDGSQPFIFPPFPGMNAESPLQCELISGRTWEEPLAVRRLREVLGIGNFYERVAAVTGIFAEGVRNLAERSPRPDVIVCAIPQEVLDVCALEESYGEVRRRKLASWEKEAKKKMEHGQLSFLPLTFGDEDEDSFGHRNLRRAIKAETMPFGIPTQIIRESTLTGASANGRSMQDEATRAWNFTTGLYYKAGGHPWRLADLPSDTCFIGISFYRERLSLDPKLRTSLAQIFSHRGDGLVLRGQPFEWDRPTVSPHMPRESASRLMREALELYGRHHSDQLPLRVVVHKSSVYWEEELAGFREVLSSVPQVDLIAFGNRGVQFLREGRYPPLRGTWVRFDDRHLLLYTRGYIPYLRTYPGMRVPWPLEILEHHGDTGADRLVEEIMALTKMNWNTADFACEEPMTVAFARRVGEILGEMPSGIVPQVEYRFYM